MIEGGDEKDKSISEVLHLLHKEGRFLAEIFGEFSLLRCKNIFEGTKIEKNTDIV